MGEPAHSQPPLPDVEALDRQARARAFLAWYEQWQREAADPSEPDWDVEDVARLRLRPAAVER